MKIHRRSIQYVESFFIGLYSCKRVFLCRSGAVIVSTCSCSWTLILGGALVSILIVGPILISVDRTDLGRAIIETKGTAMSYITSWGTENEEEGEDLEIGDDQDIDYDDYKDQDLDVQPHVGRKDSLDKENKIQTKNDTSFLNALKDCTDMICVRKAHELPKKDATFNFPHFLIIGFQKAATTSLHVCV